MTLTSMLSLRCQMTPAQNRAKRMMQRLQRMSRGWWLQNYQTVRPAMTSVCKRWGMRLLNLAHDACSDLTAVMRESIASSTAAFMELWDGATLTKTGRAGVHAV